MEKYRARVRERQNYSIIWDVKIKQITKKLLSITIY